ncbi:MFS transporter [Variovorax sp. PBL-E5]|uniref:MFS transporter n=1 Tax=unclassified Variovorax TaxID=663243 RepID=UPI00131734C5|nr:MFS transporter [Variovorax sp. PBL-E5]VTU45410.1 Multidrug-efflux transporter 3 [Variovorax sp. PBL-E5]VTU46438.1 Multidrug-efflux transporter 3 [Variovorax sp. SRS16]
MAMLGLCFVATLVALDQTVVSTALPAVVAELHGFDLYAWVATSYLLTSVITVPVVGRLGDQFGRKPFVLTSIVIFSVASALCGLANSMDALVLARALQGLGGGMLVGSAFACIVDLFPDAVVRLRWQVMMASAFGISNTLGPSLGGLLTQYLGWRWVFYINLPVGLVSLYSVWRFLPHFRHGIAGAKARIDWPGALLIATGLGSMQLLVELVPQRGFTVSMICLLAACGFAFVALYWWERRAAHPLIPLELMRNRALASMFLLAAASGFMMFSLLVYVPLMFQGGFDLSARTAGLLVTPLVAFIAVANIANSRILLRLPHSAMMVYLGFAMTTLCGLCMLLARPVSSHGYLLAVMMCGGLGMGLMMPNLTISMQQSAPREHVGIAIALLQSQRMVGGMLGTALTGAVVNWAYRSGIGRALEDSADGAWRQQLADPEVLLNHDMQMALLSHLAAAGRDGTVLIGMAREALVSAIHTGFWLTIAVGLFGLLGVRHMPKISFRSKSRIQPQEGFHEL